MEGPGVMLGSFTFVGLRHTTHSDQSRYFLGPTTLLSTIFRASAKASAGVARLIPIRPRVGPDITAFCATGSGRTRKSRLTLNRNG
jgi:hypothetical protein